MHLTSSPIDWYAARAGGVVAYILLTTVVLLGLGLSSRRAPSAGRALRCRTSTGSPGC